MQLQINEARLFIRVKMNQITFCHRKQIKIANERKERPVDLRKENLRLKVFIFQLRKLPSPCIHTDMHDAVMT